METNRRGFFATAASGLAWLAGVKPETLIPKPMSDEQRRQFKDAWMVTMGGLDTEIVSIRFYDRSGKPLLYENRK